MKLKISFKMHVHVPVNQWNDAAMEKFTKWAHYFSTWLIHFLWFRVQTSISLNEEDPLNIEFPPERNAVSGTSSVHQYMNVSISQIAVKYCSFFQIFMCFAIYRCLNILITAFFCLSALHALFFLTFLFCLSSLYHSLRHTVALCLTLWIQLSLPLVLCHRKLPRTSMTMLAFKVERELLYQ